MSHNRASAQRIQRPSGKQSGGMGKQSLRYAFPELTFIFYLFPADFIIFREHFVSASGADNGSGPEHSGMQGAF